MIHRLLGRVLGLPARRGESDVERLAVAMPDGVRLATTHVWPVGCEGSTPTLVVRTPYGIEGGPRILLWLGRLLAERGYHVVLQDVRGRHASEGEFEPFVHEADDGAATLDWLDAQSWCEGPVGLLGASYLAYAAWAAASRRPERIGALAIAIGSSDLFPVFHPHGVFSLANALEWATGVGEREGVDARQVDLDRAFFFSPIREADRVARRCVDFYRTWVDRTERDDYWERVRVPLPEPAPPTLFVAGCWDFFLEPQLEDHAALCEAAHGTGSSPPALLLGPWAHGPVAHRRFWRDDMQRRSLPAIVAHFDRHLASREAGVGQAAVRFFVCDPRGRGEWREAERWPPEGSHARTLYLRGRGRGGLAEGTTETEARIEIEYDPSDPTPSIGGALFGWKAGTKDQRPLLARHDVAWLESNVLADDLVIAGPVRAHLRVGAELLPADFALHLIDAAPDGSMLAVGDGLGRLAEVPAQDAHDLDVSLGHRAWRFRAGHRLRLHVAPAHCPRFARARAPGLDGDPPRRSRQWITCSAKTPSTLTLTLASGSRLSVRGE